MTRFIFFTAFCDISHCLFVLFVCYVCLVCTYVCIFYFIFISTFILLTRRKATEALIHMVGNYLPPASGNTKILLSACNLIEI